MVTLNLNILTDIQEYFAVRVAVSKPENAKRKVGEVMDEARREAQAKLTHNQDVDELELPCPHGTLAADTSKASKRECELCWEVFKQLTGEQ